MISVIQEMDNYGFTIYSDVISLHIIRGTTWEVDNVNTYHVILRDHKEVNND